MNNTPCCSCGSNCCEPEQPVKKLIIDFLYLDLTVCERCQSTENSLDEALDEVSAVLKAAGYEIVVNKININSEELAIKYQFVSSPTIRINGNDIAMDVQESACKECGDLCGDSVDCRVWVHEGIEYNAPPKALIINAILKAIYSNVKADSGKKEEYRLPENLKVFFEGVKDRC